VEPDPAHPAPAAWVACNHFRERLRGQLEATIPGIDHLGIEVPSNAQSTSCLTDTTQGADLKLTVVSSSFDGVRMLQRQRLVHVALQSELASGAIHSLPDLQTLTPEQWTTKRSAAHLKWVDERLRAAIPNVEHLDIVDSTDGHAAVGFEDGSKRALDPNGVELQLTVVSAFFDGMKLIERQMLVSDALGPELLSGAIHSLPQLRTLTPKQWSARVAGAKGGATVKRQRTECEGGSCAKLMCKY